MTETLLIVDDDEFVCQVNETILSGVGYQVSLATDGQVAWEMIEKTPDQFDLILLDKHMPRMDGMEFLRLLKSHPLAREVPVIMLTGDRQQQDIVEGLNAGAYYYLTKPSSEAMLKQVVRNALDEFRQKGELRDLIGRHNLGLRGMTRAEFTLRTIQEAKSLAIVLADAGNDPGRTVNGYSELLINAVEHGNLGISYEEKSRLLSDGCWTEEVERRQRVLPYSERRVSILLARHREATVVTITDEGDGFDWRKYLVFDPERAFDLHGRGIAMSKAMSFDDIRYIGSGNTVITTVVAATANRKAGNDD